MVANSVPRGTVVAAADSNAGQTAAGGANSAAPVVIAGGIAARAVAVQPDSAPADGARETSIFLSNADEPNRIFSLNIAPPGAGSMASAYPAAVAGIGRAGSLGDGGTAAAAELNLTLDSFNMRSGVAVAADGTIFVADTRNATIRRIASPDSSEPGVIRTIAGRWAARQNIELLEPMGLALDRDGNLYIADHGANAVLVMRAALSSAPAALKILVNARQPGSIAVTPDGSKIFVATPENGAVYAIGARTHEIEPVAGFAGKPSSCPLSGAAPAKQEAGAACPAGLALDGGGNLFVADKVANHIVRVDTQTAAVTIAASDLSAPGEISFDASGDLFVAEQGRKRILKIRALGVPLNTVSLSPAVHDFGAEPTRGTSVPVAFTLTNSTNAAITGLTFNAFQGGNPGDFRVVSTSCVTTLAANSTCVINVAFSPNDGDVGPLTAQLTVNYTGAVNPLTSTLTGTGANYDIVLADKQNMIVTVTAGFTATYNLEITPDSNFPAVGPYTATMVCPPIAPPNSLVIPPGVLPTFTTCTMAPASMAITPGTNIPVKFTVMTTSRTTGILGSAPAIWSGPKPGGRSGPLLFPALLAILVAAILWSLGKIYGLGSKIVRIASSAVVFIVVAALIAGCGGGGKKINGTPAGTSTFLVQATVQDAQGNSLNVTRGISLQLIVQ